MNAVVPTQDRRRSRIEHVRGRPTSAAIPCWPGVSQRPHERGPYDTADADAPAQRIEVAGRADLIVTDAGRHVRNRHAEQRDHLVLDALTKRAHADEDAARPRALDGQFHLIVPFGPERRVRDMREGPLRREPRADRRRQELFGSRRHLAMRRGGAERQAVTLATA